MSGNHRGPILTFNQSDWDGTYRIYANGSKSQFSLSDPITTGTTGRLISDWNVANLDLNSNTFTTSGWRRGITGSATDIEIYNTGDTAVTLSQITGQDIYIGYTDASNVTVDSIYGIKINLWPEQGGTGNSWGNLIGIEIDTEGSETPTGDIVSLRSNNSDAVMEHAGPIQIGAYILPNTDGDADHVLTTNGSGVVTWAALPAAGISSIIDDTTPQLGGNLDVNGYKITSTSNANIEIEPNGTGDVLLTADTVRVGDVNAAATVTTNGTGNLVLNTNSGTNSGAITVNQGTNANIVLAPNGTGMTMLNNIEYHEKVHSLGTTSGTVAPDVANGNVQTITLNGNLTLNAFTSPITGQSLTLIINTNSTGRTLTSSMKFAGGEKTLSTTNTTDIISVFYDGTNYWASLAKDFK
jgi:hypothetical protein